MSISIEGLKEKARRYEQDEEWRKALDLYLRAIQKLDEDDRPDIGLHNRVGDLFTRVGDTDQAVEHYETAVDLYEEADLPNNAIAVCKKIVRNVPNRDRVYLRMGLIRARQGFVVDARQCFLTYAERRTAAGDLDEALRALVEFADLVPEDTEIRVAIADQYRQHDRTEKAVEQLAVAHGILRRQGDDAQAEALAERIVELDPDADLEELAAALETRADRAEAPEVGISDDSGDIEVASAFDEIFTDEEGGEEEEEGERAARAAAAAGVEGDMGLDLTSGHEEDEDVGDTLRDAFEEVGPGIEEDDDEDYAIGDPLPLMDFGDDEEDDDEAAYGEALDAGLDGAFGLDEDEAASDEDDAVPLPLLEGTEDYAEEEDAAEAMRAAVEAAAEEALEERRDAGDAEAALSLDPDEVRAELEASPDDVELHQRAVELAFRGGDESRLVEAYMGLAGALERGGSHERARGVYQQVLAMKPDHPGAMAGAERVGVEARPAPEVASSEDYVDLGALILGEDDEKTTRFVVAYEEPSGDEDADFRKMLSQFKAKVAENVDASDVKAHHDLGTAYKEMGLLDEAIEEYQKALRASGDHLPTYELLGQAFLEKEAPAAAARVLSRALNAPWEVEDELLGIYYYLGRAHEAQGNTREALEFYDRVFSLDINFADVTERLRALR